ncbi:MAG TPA: tetratricopeptide repeat protein [Candidatus Polarisedimenticolaceae bacterium]|nr:tetratricopeptide repeat protein [Candidatus Polarisedimenticolaceae bacterium]
MSRFGRRLGAILAAGFVLRVAYVVLQPRFDPTFGHPILDGAYYVDAARSLLAHGLPASVYYMPPLYPAALAVFFRLFGEAWSVLFLFQHAAIVAAAGLLGIVARRAAGDGAGLAAAALVLLYHPALFFASRPLGEPLALLALAAAVAIAGGFGAGVASGLAALVRPNLLPVSVVWAARDLVSRRWARAVGTVGAAALVVLPTACHNRAVSGHLVPVSANGGVVFWLGNAPGAVGVYTPSRGFSGALATQQAEAIAEARAESGRPLDAVTADSFWWRKGLQARLADPGGSLVLLARRAALTIDDAEHGLDDAPALDPNPLRWIAPVPFAVIIGLAAFGVAGSGWVRTGGFPLWSAVAVAALAPLLFYVSSRHRLPVACLLAVPAGCGVPGLKAARPLAMAVGLLAAGLSFAVPSGDLVRTERAGALATLADVHRRAGDLGAAEAAARRATTIDPANAIAWFNLGAIEAAQHRPQAAEQDYRQALAADPEQPDAAANLAGILVATGRPAEAGALLERAVAAWPRHEAAWTNLIVAYVAAGEPAEARAAVKRAETAGIALEPGLIEAVGGGHR